MKTKSAIFTALSLGVLSSTLAFGQVDSSRTFSLSGGTANESILLKVTVQGDHGVDGRKYNLPSAVYYKVSARVGLEDNGAGGKEVNFYDIDVKPVEFSGEFSSEDKSYGHFSPLHIEIGRDRAVGQEMRARIHLLSGGFEGESKRMNLLGASLLGGIGAQYGSIGKFRTTDGIEDVDTIGALGNYEINGFVGVRLQILEGLVEAVLKPIEFERAILSNSDWKDTIQNSLAVNIGEHMSLFVSRNKRTYGMNQNFIAVPDDSQFKNINGVSHTRWEIGGSISIGKKKKKGQQPNGY